MKHRQIDIERAAAAINAERAVDHEERVTLKIQEIMADPGELWGSFADDSRLALQKLMLCSTEEDTCEAWEEFYSLALDFRSALRCEVAKTAAEDTTQLEPAPREDAIDYLEMRESDDE